MIGGFQTTIAICGELGAGCTEVGQSLSKRLGLRCISSADIIRRIVIDFRKIHPSESFKEFEEHVHSGEVDLDKMIDGELNEILEQGDTIVEGRSAFMLLDSKDVFKVLLVAPRTKRVEHIAKIRGITAEEAREIIERSDSERKHMVERLFKKDWLDPHNYDIIINTGFRTYEEATDLIVKAVRKQ